MIAKYGKRALSFFLAVIMIVSAVPMQVFAEDGHDHGEESSVPVSTTSSAQAGESAALIALRAEIAAYVEELGITPDMPDQYLLYAYGNHESYEAAQASLTKQDEFLRKGALLSEAEQKILLAEDNTKLAQRYREVAEKAYATEVIANASFEVNKITISNNGGDLKNSNGTLTATVAGTSEKGCTGSITYTAATMYIYIKNNTGEDGLVSFDMEQTSINSIVVGSENIKGTGNYSKNLANGEEFCITIKTGEDTTTNKLVLKNITFTPASKECTVKVEYPHALCSVTSSMEGTSEIVGGTTTITIPGVTAADGVLLTATGDTFLGWVDQNNTLLSTEKSYTVYPSEDMTVKAVMTEGKAYFLANGVAYSDLNAAANAAADASSKTITLMNNGTLPAGNYTIPSGVTLSIPCETAYVVQGSDYTTKPGIIDDTNKNHDRTAATPYLKLTMADGANLTVNGSLQIAGNQSCTQAYNGLPVDPAGWITMENGSRIIVNGNLYAWGIIDGNGTVDLNSGASAYECFYITDWRGGSATTGIVGNKHGVFPMDQYTIPNVKVRMTIHSGAKEYGYMSVKVSGVGIQGASVPFINNSDGMFRITSGSITKWNDGRLHVEVNGKLSVASLSVSMKLGILGNTTINSKDYNLPINNKMSVTVKDGSVINVNQDLALLPGSELIVESGATATLGSGKKIIVYDADDFNGADYVWPNTTNEYANAPDAKVVINGTADLSAGAAYTTSGGANISGNGTIIVNGKNATATKTHQYNQIAESYIEIGVQPGALQNADNTTTATADDLGVVTYKSVGGVWTCEHTYAAGTFVEKIITAATCLQAGSKTLYCNCGQDSKTVEISILAHEYVAVVTAPTCTEAGYTTHTCKNGCNDSYTDTPVNALGHTAGAEADCENAQTCTVCGTELIAALGHIPGAEADCENAQVCTRCGDELVAALGHTPGAEADCENAQVCTRCGVALVAALGHNWEWVIDEEATVLAAGVKHEECSVCHAKQNENTVIPMLKCSHAGTMNATGAKDVTCTEDGNSAYWYCSACQNYYSDAAGQYEIEKNSWVISANGHTAGAEATCETAQTCTVCGAELVAALGHDEVAHEAQAPTCKAVGWEAYVSCSRCDYSTYVELPADPDAHVWDEGEEYGNHSCNSPLRMKYTCTVEGCSKTKFEVIIEQHFRVPIAEEIPATCTTDGMTSGMKCEKCDEFWIPQEVIPALGHDWNGAYPCESDSSACTRCSVKFDSKQEHLVVIEPGTPATCTQTGLSDGSHCGYCGVTLTEQTETPVTDHNWFVDEMEIPATCTTNGHKAGASYCLDCDYDEDPIPALSHSWMHRDAKKATYSAIGWNAHDYCLLCKATKTLAEYEEHACEFCGENPEGYIEIPLVPVQSNKTYEEIVTNLYYLEMMAAEYAKQNPGTDPLGLVLNYMRTGVSNYTSGSWAIMAGAENKDFLKFVQESEDAINSDPDIDVWVNVSGLKKLYSVSNAHGEYNVYQTSSKVPVMSGHFFGTMDMTYYNKGSQNHADVGGWVGDLTDLLSTSDEFGVPANLTLDEKVEYIREKYLFKTDVSGSAGSFGHADLYADLDGYYFMNELITNGYEPGDLTALMREYYQPGLTLAKRVSYLLTNRLDGLSTRKDLRTAVYNAYTSNKLIATLEGTRNFNATGNELTELRKAVCYAFADEICFRAGDYVEDLTNPRFTVFDTETKILAPGVSQQINYATNADGNQIVYYIATADVMREDVGVWVNYYDRDPGTPENPQWKNNSVPGSAQNAQDRFGDPESEDYIENFNVIASTNAGGYDMSDVATPGGLVVMNGIEWFPQTTTAGFFAIMDDGTAYMGSYEEYAVLKNRIKEAIGGFGEFVVKDGQVVGSAAASDAPRTSVGITATGRVVLMCIDGRQAPFSSGASLQDVGYIMKEAGCVVAINLDGGGSTTFVARQPGDEELTIMNRPSDGYPRNVSTNLLIYSTAPSSTKFDHAVIESEYDYATVNTPVQMTAAGVSPAGNAVDIPEGATWAVSDEAWASISADGVFTGKRMGEVTVYLMLDGKTIGSKLMTMTEPDQVYFEKAKVDAIYGSGVVLPLRARVGGKPIAINPSDVTFTLSAPDAGTMTGFTFNAVESSVKTMSITAALNENAKATINVMLYKQGENSFDFDKATGGDRTLAWDRQVTNSKVEDGNIYNVIDPSKDMITSYTFALDMTALPIPERLEELTYMLPGGTMEGSNAWTFLTSLAQRISDLSWVKATIDFDDRFNVDYTELKVLNDYFTLKNAEFDETTNTLTINLGWVKQSQVINAATANPLLMINGIKLTPKDGIWTDVSKINVANTGNIGYEIYMRASGLYSFAQKPESQAVFGIYPYRNPADTTDAGGYFFNTYAEITDEYTLVNVLKEGWVNEDGGFAYYVEGERLTGVQKVDGFYYDFGEQGINVGQTALTGLFYDETAKAYRYSYMGELTGGWQSINGEWYYFSNTTMNAVSGKRLMHGIYLEFEENGKLVSGGWAKTLKGMRYYYGPNCYWTGWAEIDGAMYYFEDSYRKEGVQKVRNMQNHSKWSWYDFGEDGIARDLPDGLFINPNDGKLYYLIGGTSQMGLHKVDGDYYFFTYDGPAVTSREYYTWETHCDLPCSTYAFGADGKMVNGLVKMSDGTYYYINGKIQSNAAGITKIGDDYYFVSAIGRVATGKYYCWATKCELPVGEYEFDAEGKMLRGIVEKPDGYYYYGNGKINNKTPGLTKIGDDYYFVSSIGRVATGKYYCWATNCELPIGEYEFDATGKMLQGLVEKSDGRYYYVNGKPNGKNAGLTKIGDDYYFVASNGRCATGKYYCWATNCDLPIGEYEFDATGKMLQGLVVKTDGTYYYVNGKPNGKNAGLTKIGDDYYFVASNGRCAVGVYNCWATNCELPTGTYEFDADGKMLHGLVQKDDGLYCYVYGKMGGNAGLIKLDGDYYFVASNGRCATGKYYAWATKCDLPVGEYEFGADGKMLNGFVTKADGTYYYINGKIAKVGLHYVDGYYYCVTGTGKLVMNQSYYVWETNGLLAETTYTFDELGRIIG